MVNVHLVSALFATQFDFHQILKYLWFRLLFSQHVSYKIRIYLFFAWQELERFKKSKFNSGRSKSGTEILNYM